MVGITKDFMEAYSREVFLSLGGVKKGFFSLWCNRGILPTGTVIRRPSGRRKVTPLTCLERWAPPSVPSSPITLGSYGSTHHMTVPMSPAQTRSHRDHQHLGLLMGRMQPLRAYPSPRQLRWHFWGLLRALPSQAQSHHPWKVLNFLILGRFL